MSMDWKAALQPFLNIHTIHRLSVAVNVLMIIALTYTAAQLTWKLLPVAQLDEPIPVTKNKSTGSKHAATKQASISELHLFGEVKAQKESEKITRAVKVPVTRLNLTLKGVIASERPDIAKAIIADSSGHENFYAIGAKIPGGAILEEIYTTHVILNRNNRLETLQLPKDVPRSQSISRSGAARAYNRNIISSSSNKDARTLLREYRQTLKTDPQKLMDLVRTQPYREKGKLVGYKVRPGRDRRLLRKFGLRSGDVVTAVNGISLDNPINGLEILKKLTTASQVSVDIKRNGIKQSLSFQVD